MIYDDNYYELNYKWVLYFRSLGLDEWDARSAAQIAMGIPKSDRANCFWSAAE